MKFEDRDLEEAKAIVSEAALVSEAVPIFIAFKKEETPQYKVKIIYPEAYKKIKEDLFLPTINLFVDGVYHSQEARFAADPQEGFKNIISRDDIEGTLREFRVRAAGLCPIVTEKDVQGLFFFFAKDTSIKTLKIVDSFAKQISGFLAVREYRRVARDVNLKVQMVLEELQDTFFTIDTRGNHIYVSPNIEVYSQKGKDPD